MLSDPGSGMNGGVFASNPPGTRRVLSGCSVGIAGAGGIGSNAAMLLARAGLGRMVVVDHDEVALPNLNRQAYFLFQCGRLKVDALAENISRTGAGTVFTGLPIRLSPGGFCAPFEDCDLLIEALDLAETKVMAIEEWALGMPGVPVIAVSGIAGTGASGTIRLERRGSISLVGDQTSGLHLGTLSTKVSLAASMVADEAVSILLERHASGASARGAGEVPDGGSA